MNDHQRSILTRTSKNVWGDTTDGLYDVKPDDNGQVGTGDYPPGEHDYGHGDNDPVQLPLGPAQPPQVELIPNNVMYATTVASLLGAVMGTLSVAIAIFALVTR